MVPTMSFLTHRVLVITRGVIQQPKEDTLQRICLYLVCESHLKLGVDVQLHSFLTSTLDRVSYQLNVTAALSPVSIQ